MNILRFLIAVAMVFMFGFVSASYAQYTVTQLTNNGYEDLYPQINDNGHVVWLGYDGSDYEIFLYDGTSTTQLATGDLGGFLPAPQINENDWVVWRGCDGTTCADHEIYLYNGTGIAQLTHNDYDDTRPQISSNGQVAWQGCDGGIGVGCSGGDWDIFLYDGVDTYLLTYNNFDDYAPQIRDNGFGYERVVWYGCDTENCSSSGDGDWEIFSFVRPYTFTRTNNDYADKDPQIDDNWMEVWVGCDGIDCLRDIGDREIFRWDGIYKTQLTDNYGHDSSARINENGWVVWVGCGRPCFAHDREIFLYDGTTTTQLTNNAYDDNYPQINDNGQVVWLEHDGSDYEIFLYDGTSTTQLTDNASDDYEPQISNNGHVVWYGCDTENCSLDGDGDLEIFLAKPNGGGCTASAVPSTLGATAVYGSSDLGRHLAYFLLPLGAIMALRTWSRKR